VRYETRVVRSLERALAALREGRWDVVLLSLSPGTDLLDPVEGVRQLAQASRAPVVVIGEHLDLQVGERLTNAGAAEWIALGDVHQALAALVERSLAWTLERAELQSALERASEDRLRAAYRDPLTELPNLQFFKQHLRSLLAQSNRSSRRLAVVMLDLDRFKPVNDSLGHSAGDEVLRAVAGRVSDCLRSGDVLARKTGDEFAIVLEGIHNAQNAAKVSRKVLSAVSRPIPVKDQQVTFTASLGIALSPEDGGDVDSLLRHADIAMYQAKESGGNSYRFFQPEMTESSQRRLELEQSLRLAVERKEFVLHYQPQYDLATDRISGMEALVRWQHPELGLVPPDRFIPVAEETGLIDPLGDWVLETACAQNRAWQDEGLPRIPVAVNLSARQFRNHRPVDRVRHALRASGLDAEYLDLEITESVVMDDADRACETLVRLRDIGVSVSIDDFGTGHSSLGYLKRFPVQRLKIDKTFIRTLLSDPRDAAITEAIIAMAHSLDMRAVAEGVETREQLDYLRTPGCDEVQGFLLSRPLPAAAAREVLATAAR
jgi:diguanylate cyclase (GGDEF)-like protein